MLLSCKPTSVVNGNRRAMSTCPPVITNPLRHVAQRDLSAAAKKRVTKTAVPDVSMSDDPNKKKAVLLDKVMGTINNKFGPGTIIKMGDPGFGEKTKTFSSGCLPLDIALGGGFAKGRVVEIFGPESSGKSTLALHAVAEIQRTGGIAVFIDMEHAFDASYAANVGVDLKTLVMSQPKDGEEALEIMDELIRSGVVNLVVLDSVAALVPRAEMAGEMGSSQVGSQARLLSLALRKLVPSAHDFDTTLMFLNQLRNKIGVLYGSPETTSGGNALKFYSSQRIDLRKKEYLSLNGVENSGVRVRAKIIKNKVAPPAREAFYDVYFATGIDSLGSLLDAAETCNVVDRRGSYYYMGEEKLGQGKEKVKELIKENSELRQRIEDATRATLSAQPPPPNEGEDDDDEIPADLLDAPLP